MHNGTKDRDGAAGTAVVAPGRRPRRSGELVRVIRRITATAVARMTHARTFAKMLKEGRVPRTLDIVPRVTLLPDWRIDYYDQDVLDERGKVHRIREFRIWSPHRKRGPVDIPSFVGPRPAALAYLADEWVSDLEDIG